MEKSIKGGYILISLGLSELSTFDGELPYDRITATKKHIVLTGLSLSGKKLPDICVSPKFNSGDIIFENVYGYDITIKSDNSVSVSEYTPVIGGTQLYKHTITRGSGLPELCLFMSSDTALTDVQKLINAFNGGNVISAMLKTIGLVMGVFADSDDSYKEKIVYCESSARSGSNLIDSVEFGTFGTDTVTEL